MARASALVAILTFAFAAPAGASPRAIPAAFGSEVAFEANAGQHDARVRFAARGRRDTLLVTPDRGVLLLPSASGEGARVPLRFGLDGARADASCRGEEELRGRANYYLGNDPARWRTGIARFARVVCSDVRPGIDVVYYGRDGRIEWDVVVARIDAAGGPFQFATYFGGTGDDSALDVAVDAAGGVYVAGFTNGLIPLRNAYQPVLNQNGGGQYFCSQHREVHAQRAVAGLLDLLRRRPQ